MNIGLRGMSGACFWGRIVENYPQERQGFGLGLPRVAFGGGPGHSRQRQNVPAPVRLHATVGGEKMQKIIGLCFVMAAAMTAFSLSPAYAYFMDGNQLLEDCRAAQGTVQAMVCLGYVEGVADTALVPLQYSYTYEGKQYKRPRVCMSTNVIAGQAKDVVVKYLDEYPEKRQMPADAIVVAALAIAFPC